MKKQRFFFPLKSHTSPEDYTPYRNCLAYIKQNSHAIPYSGRGQAQRLEIMEKVGMKNYAKFHRRRVEWDNLEGKIPLKYLEAIGVDMDVLSFCLELDNSEYLSVLSIERKVPFATARLGAFFYRNIRTPEGFTSEDDAIAYFNSFMLDPNVLYTHLWIYFPGIIRHTFLKGKGHTETSYYYPAFTVSNGMLQVKEKSASSGINWI